MEKKLLLRLYEEYSREIYLYLYSLSHDPETAQDLTQETFLKAILSLSDNHPNMRAWLYLVARNLFLNYARKQSLSLSLADTGEKEDPHGQEPLLKILENERRRILYQGIITLPPLQKEVLLLQYFSGLSQREIAAILKKTPENIRVLSHRGKKALKSYLEVTDYDIS